MSDGFFQVPTPKDDNNTGAVVAIVVVVFLLFLLLSGAGVASYRKVRSCRRKAANKLYEQQGLGNYLDEEIDGHEIPITRWNQETPAPAGSSGISRHLGTCKGGAATDAAGNLVPHGNQCTNTSDCHGTNQCVFSAAVTAAKKVAANVGLAQIAQTAAIAKSMASCTQKTTANTCTTAGTYCAMIGGECQPDYASKNLPSKFTSGPNAKGWVNELRSMVESAGDQASWKRMQTHAAAMESQEANQLIVGHCAANPSITCNAFNAQKAAHCGTGGNCVYDLSKQAGYSAYCTGMVGVPACMPGANCNTQAKGTCCDPQYVLGSHANMMHCAADYVEWNGVQKGSTVEVVSAGLNALGKEPFQYPYVTEYSSQLSWPTKTAPGTVTQASFPAMCGNMTAATGDYVTYPEDGGSVDAYPVANLFNEVYNSLVADNLPVSRAGNLNILTPQIAQVQSERIKV